MSEDPEEQGALRARLRAAADAHQPDRARMLARIAQTVDEPGARHGPRPPLRSRSQSRSQSRSRSRSLLRPRRVPVPGPRAWPRMAGAVGAFVMVLGIGGTAVWWTQHGSGGTGEESRPPTVRAPAGPAVPGTASDGPLRSSGAVDPGSNAYWSQTEVTVRTRKPLRALTVELRIVDGRRLSSTGSWRSRPPEDFEVSVRQDRGSLVYRWKLKQGRTVPSGTHVFAGQFDHAAGKRSTEKDAYTIAAVAGERPYAVGGGIG